ncbi:MAG: hypothetical protein IK015_08435 [Treponema sp.]|nr:hypothetical protein [Treponema sp.]
MANMESETTDLARIFMQFGIYRNTLSKAHNDFVKRQLQKDYDIVTKTYNLQGRIYKGTYKEDAGRKLNKVAYEKEAKLATVLAALGFDVILIEENSAKSGTKPDAIVNGIVVDFKEIKAFYEKDATRNTLGNEYQRGMKKVNSEGVVIFLHNFSESFVRKNMGFKKTRPGKNGLALFFHEDTGTLQLIDMKKVRAAQLERPMSSRTSGESAEHSDNY